MGGVGIFLLLVAGILGLFVYPLVNGIAQDAAALRSLKEQLVVFQQDEKNAKEFQQIIQSSKEEFEKLDTLLVEAATPIAFIEFLEQEAAPPGLEVKIAIGQAKKQRGDTWPSLDFQVSTRASFSAFFAFLQKLENSPYLLKAESVNARGVKKKEGETGEQQVEFSLFFKVFTKEL